MKVNPALQQYLNKVNANNQAPAKDTDFKELLKNELSKINELQLKADEASRQLALGETEDIHETTEKVTFLIPCFCYITQIS